MEYWILIGIFGWFIYSSIQSYAWTKNEKNPAIVFKDYTELAFIAINFILIVIDILAIFSGFSIHSVIITLLTIALTFVTFSNTYIMQNRDMYKTVVIWSGKSFLVVVFIYFMSKVLGGAGERRSATDRDGHKYYTESSAEYGSRDTSERLIGGAGVTAVGYLINQLVAERKFSNVFEFIKSANAKKFVSNQ